jgi:hypothetical protein
MSPTVGSVGGMTLVIWPDDHDPPHVHAIQGTPNTAGAKQSRIAIETGNVIDKRSKRALPDAKLKQAQEWIAEHRDEVQRRWKELQT